MNSEYHIHEMKIERMYVTLNRGPTVVRYGDQQRLWPMPGWKRGAVDANGIIDLGWPTDEKPRHRAFRRPMSDAELTEARRRVLAEIIRTHDVGSIQAGTDIENQQSLIQEALANAGHAWNQVP